MTDERLEHKVSLARRAGPSWTLARQQQALWRVQGHLRQRRRAILSLGALSVAAAAGALFWVGVQRLGSPSTAELAIAAPSANQAAAPEHWNLRDGSLVSIETRSTVVRKKLETPSQLVLELESGAADFDVSHRPARAFLVNAGFVTVKVTGTRFRVEKLGEQASVSVRRGSVIVQWPGGSRTLGIGESGVFPPRRAVTSSSGIPAPKGVSEPPKEIANNPSGKASTHGAREALRDVLSEPESLFARSDRARSEGRLAEAAGLLKTLVDRYPRDPRAPLAAFTRGRILLESLGRPADAAAAFSHARALSQSAIAEDALAREVEAYRAAGNLSRARERAELYRRTYPNSVRLRQVMRSGGFPGTP